MSEHTIRDSVDVFRLAFDGSPDVISISRISDGLYRDVNQRFSEVLGYAREEVIGKSAEELDIWAHRAERRQLVRSLETQGLVDNLEAWFRAKDGHLVAGLLSGRMVTVNGEMLLLTMTRDITAQARTREQVQRAERLNALGVLAGGIAHDFNNVLTAIFGNVSAAIKVVSQGHEVHSYLADVEEALGIATHLTNQLLTFARGGEPQRDRVSLVDLAQDSVKFALSGSRVRLVFNVIGEIPLVSADAGQIRQVLSNVTLNAIQAMPEGGELFVTVDHLTSHDEPHVPVGPCVKIVLRDTGRGISQRVLAKIFDPYFTTKASGRGLGMAIVHSIITRHGGHVTISSERGGGTEVGIYLPVDEIGASAAASEVSEASEVSPSVEGHDEGDASEAAVSTPSLKILILDDEPLIQRAVGRLLRQLGHRMEGVDDGEAAIAAHAGALEAGDPFDVLIMDLTISGGLGGQAALKEILAHDPGAVALVSSGYSHDPVMANYADYGFKGVLPKPFTMEILDRELRRVVSQEETESS